METSTPPENSIIKVEPSPEGLKLSWPLPTSMARFGVVAFMCFWLCGWAFGEVMVAKQILAGQGNLFMFGWLGAWTIGGAFVIFSIWKALKPMKPESILLSFDNFTHFPGYTPFIGTSGQHLQDVTSPKQLLKKPVSVTLSRQQLASGFVLDRVGERQRLRFDQGAKRIEIGSVLSEPEREWLHQLLEQWRVS